MATHRIDERMTGVFVTSPTPFLDNGALDIEGTDRLVDSYVEKGVTGSTILGEATRLTPDGSSAVTKRFFAGGPEGAEDVFVAYLPVPRHGQQIGFGFAVREEILRRRGALATAHVRHPGPKLAPRDIQELDELMARLDRKLGA